MILFYLQSNYEILFIAKFKYDSFQCNQYCFETPISGMTNICKGQTDTLYNLTSSGTWSSGNVFVATIDSITGVIKGTNQGSSIITYFLPQNCYTTTTVTVINSVPLISGSNSVCVGSIISLSDSIGLGKWSSTNTNVSIDSAIGKLTGIGVGTSIISYTLGTGCIVTKTITINYDSKSGFILGPDFFMYWVKHYTI